MSKPVNGTSAAQEQEYLAFRKKLYKGLLKRHANDPVLGPILRRAMSGATNEVEMISPEQARRYRHAAKRISSTVSVIPVS